MRCSLGLYKVKNNLWETSWKGFQVVSAVEGQTFDFWKLVKGKWDAKFDSHPSSPYPRSFKEIACPRSERVHKEM